MVEAVYGVTAFELGKDVTHDFDVQRSKQVAQALMQDHGIDHSADLEYQGMTDKSMETADKLLDGTDFELI